MLAGELFRAMRPLPLFAHIGDAELDALASRLKPVHVEAGAAVMQEGEEATAAFLILNGDVEIFRSAGAQEVQIALRTSGDLIGEMGLLTGERRNATARSRVPACILPIPSDEFESFLMAEPGAMRALLRTTTARLQNAEAYLVQHQKMAALGTLAAGLTHELNNPAAAVARSVEHLRSAISDWDVQARALGSLNLDPFEEQALEALRVDMGVRTSKLLHLDPLERGDREQAVQRWLAARQIDEAWRLASLLVDGAWNVESLQSAIEPFGERLHTPLLWWLAAGQSVHGLLRELGVGARAISDIVMAVKTYTRLDQTPVQEVDIHEGIEQSLLILRHKLRGVSVHRKYAPDLPRMTVFASELNQVWTNLFDNALDALNGQGELWIETRFDRDRSHVAIEVVDSGPGVSPDIKHRLFEPFFTTKPVGKGTGLGLSISYNIVRKHQGDIQVESRPGRTRFIVLLPVNGVIE
jgi:signal transduction histidine kinase